MKRAQEDVRMINVSCGRQQISLNVARSAVEAIQTYRKEPPDPRPHGIVGQLPPPSLVHDSSLVHDTTNEVDQHRNQRNDTKHATGAQRLRVRMYDTACRAGASLKKICAVIDSSNERYAALTQWFGFT